MNFELQQSNMKIFIGWICLCLVSASALAEGTNKIDGAFGISLGDSFVETNAIGKNETTSGEPMYQFEPKNPHEAFTRYYVLTTPKTKKVYCIWAIAPAIELEKAKFNQDVVFKALTNKYGPGEKQGLFETMSDLKQIDQGNRYITVNVSGFGSGQLNLRYYDKALRDIAESERIAIESEKKDNSGL